MNLILRFCIALSRFRMESIHQDYDSFMEDASDSQSTPPCSPDINDITSVRVGHAHQAEIPLMLNESEQLQLPMNPTDSELCRFGIGLPVPTIWVHDNELKDSGIVTAEAADAKKSSLSVNGTELRPITFQSAIATENNRGQSAKRENKIMAPGTLSKSWSDSDVKSFVLGLFIFGKNFIQIKNFLENKVMADILSFYYGKFYKSDEYRRWTSCKKMKGKKCMTGQKLFTGRRHHELLSRLIPHVSEEFQDTLQRISKSYMDGRTFLEEFIYSLKSIVGLGILVEAVGIGKEKEEDLTSFPAETGKNNCLLSIPTSKAWSSLGLSDIVSFLTGGFRLSKAKSNDLFWEAVWPRLLARGWHSEQPNNQGFICSKDFLVFLVPGVKRFSRRNLVKGDHYFDSISDVLSKVAAEPNLLELEGEEGKARSFNEEETENGSTEDGQPGYRRHCYLKPRASISNADPMKFMVIDTSLAHGGESSGLKRLISMPGNSAFKYEVGSSGINHDKGDKHYRKFTVVDTSFPDEGKNSLKVRELEYPLGELEDISKTGISREIDRSSSDDSSSRDTEATMLICRKKNIGNAAGRDATNPKEVYANPDDNASKVAESLQCQKIGLSDGNHLKKTIKHQFCRRPRSGHSNPGVHTIKRRRLTACVKAETSRILESSKLGVSRVSNEKNVGLVPFSAKGSAKENNNKGSDVNIAGLDKHIHCDEVETCELQPRINFDSAQVPPKSEDGEAMPVTMEVDKQLNDTIISCEVEKPQTTPCDDVVSKEQQLDMAPRRQSTRNRPWTARALECIANEFLHVKSRQKRKGVQKPKDSFSTSHRDRAGGQTPLEGHSSGQETAISMEEKHLNGDLGFKE